jgi:hypothetical protein
VLIPVTVRRATAYQLTHLASRRISNKGQAQTPTKRALCGPCGPCVWSRVYCESKYNDS